MQNIFIYICSFGLAFFNYFFICLDRSFFEDLNSNLFINKIADSNETNNSVGSLISFIDSTSSFNRKAWFDRFYWSPDQFKILDCNEYVLFYNDLWFYFKWKGVYCLDSRTILLGIDGEFFYYDFYPDLRIYYGDNINFQIYPFNLCKVYVPFIKPFDHNSVH